jgi:hypothetical protein
MTLAETTRYRTRRTRSATEVVSDLDVLKLVRLGVWVLFCVLLLLA